MDHQYECPMSQAFNKIAHLAKALQKIQTFTWDQGSDIFGLGAKAEIYSSVAPSRKKNLVTIFSLGQVLVP